MGDLGAEVIFSFYFMFIVLGKLMQVALGGFIDAKAKFGIVLGPRRKFHASNLNFFSPPPPKPFLCSSVFNSSCKKIGA